MLQAQFTTQKVNNLLTSGAPESEVMAAVREAREARVKLDQDTCPREAGIASDQQHVQFNRPVENRSNPNLNNSRPYSGTSMPTPQFEAGEQITRPVSPIRSIRQDTPARMTPALLDNAISNPTAEYSHIQDMVRQALADSPEDTEPEKSILAKAGVKLGSPPTYNGERNLEKFETWVASVL